MSVITQQKIAQFQGTLNVPIFQAPYSLPPNAGQSFLLRSGSQAAYSDSSVYQGAPQAANNPSGVMTSDITVFTLQQLVQMTIGGGNNGDPIVASLFWPSTFADFDFVSFLSPYWNETIGNEYAGGFNFQAISNGANVPSLTPPDNAIINIAGYGTTTEEIALSLGTMPCVSNYLLATVNLGGVMALTQIVTNDPTPPTVLFLFFYFPLVKNGFAAPFPSFPLVPLTESQQAQLFGNYLSVPDYKNSQNVFISQSTLSGSPGYYGFYFSPIPGTIEVLNGPFQFVTDNTTLNTLLASGSGYRIRAMANGWLFSSATADYYIDADWNRYWQLQYIAGAPGIPLPSNGFEAQETNNTRISSKMIDRAGYFWYSGPNAYNSSTGLVTPLYSFGYDLPFNPPILPSVPPIKIPCWPPCSEMDSPFDSVYTGNRS
jgi:hypothetical protein